MDDELLISVSSYMVENGMKAETAKRSIRNINYFLKTDGEGDPSSWYRDFLQKDVSDSYKYQMYYSVKWYLRFKGEDWKFKRPKQHRKVRQNLSIEKCWMLIERISNAEHKLMVETALLTGMRPSELLSIEDSDIDFFDNTILIRSTKTYQDRLIPIGKELAQKLQYYIFKNKSKGRLFPYKPEWFAKIVRDAAKEAGFRATPYMLRHTFSTIYLENSGNLISLKHILGHSQLSTTESYVHESKAMLRRDYERAKPKIFV